MRKQRKDMDETTKKAAEEAAEEIEIEDGKLKSIQSTQSGFELSLKN